MRVRITSAAWRDIESISDWIAPRNPQAASKLTDELLDRAEELGEAPFRYPVVPETTAGAIRKRSHRNYAIFYRVGDDVEVLRIFDVRRDYLPILQDL